jgi:hypothetical protein
MTKKKSAPVFGGFVEVTERLPDVESHSPVQSSSKLQFVQLADGKLMHAYYHVWDRDMNAPHIQAKKGDSFWATELGEVLSDVIAFQSN